jgi:flavodoxin
MNALVVYDSQYGNTEKIAQAIAEALSAYGPAQAVRVASADSRKVEGADLVIVGCPTQAWRATPAVRSFLAHVPPDAWAAVSTASFDTRFHKPRLLTGSAARGIAKQMAGMGNPPLVPAESFFVGGSQGPLEEGEVERARKWARAVHDRFAAKITP